MFPATQDLDYKEYWAWTLTEVEVLDPPIPVPSIVARGSVTWMLRTRWEAWDAGHLGLQPKISDFFGRDSSAASSTSLHSRIRSRSRAAAGLMQRPMTELGLISQLFKAAA